MRFNAPRTAMVLQTAYPVLIALYAILTFPSDYAEAQKYPGPPFYLPFEVFAALLCSSLLITALLLWIKTAVGWLLSILLDAAVALFFVYFIASDRLVSSPMPLWIDLVLAVLGVLFAVIPACLLSRQSLKLFRIFVSDASKPNQVSP